VDDEISVDEDVLSVDEDTSQVSVDEDADALSVDDEPAVEADDSSNGVLKTTGVVTNDTFYNYFDDTGTLLDNVTDDELVFDGDFSEIGVSYMQITKSIKLSGNNSIFKDVSFIILADDVVFDGFKLSQTTDISLIYIQDVNNVIISNNVMEYGALEGFDSYAIYANTVEALKIINNTITYIGNTNGTVVNSAIRIEGDEDNEIPSDEITIQGNTFYISIPSVAVSHPDMYSMENTKIFSSGVELLYCTDVDISDNEMTIGYNDYHGTMDTIYGIVVRGNPMNFMADVVSDDISINNNTIKGLGHGLIYGILVAGNNFEVCNNNVTVLSDSYYANGIEVEGPSETGIVENNTIIARAPGATYGIISGVLRMGSIEDVIYIDNSISTESYLSCGMQLSEWGGQVINNTIIALGNYTVGICDSIAMYPATIYGNDITCSGSNIGTDYTGDGILGRESIGIAVLGDVLIDDNNISSTGIGIKASEKGQMIITDNNINVTANSGKSNNYAIFADEIDGLELYDNNITFSGMVDYQFEIVDSYEYGGYVYYVYDTSNNTRSYGVYVKKSDVVIASNNFIIEIPTFDVNWGITREAFSEGIVLDGCDDLVLSYNNISISTNGGEDWNTIYGIDILNSANAVLSNNNITVESIGYIYAIIIDDENFTISDNNIGVSSDNYACGIDVEGAASGVIDNNYFLVFADSFAYPVYTGMTSGEVNVNITDNNIVSGAYYVVGLEIAANNALIENNNISVFGNHTIGIGAKTSELSINNNRVFARASNEGNISVWDGMGTENVGIKVISGNVTMFDNVVFSNAIGLFIGLNTENALVEDNAIGVIANNGKVNNIAIFADDLDTLVIDDNNIYFNGKVDNQFNQTGNDTYGYPIYDTSDNTVSYGIFIVNSDVTITDNTMFLNTPAFAVNWGATREAFSEGIVLEGCDDLVLSGNDILICTNGGSSGDTLYGIDILNSANPYIVDNNITVNSTGYIYGIIINDENFTIVDNSINVSSDNYACGIDVEGTAKGEILYNDITATAVNSAYPIYSGMNYMPVDVTIDGNDIAGEAYYVVGIEVGGTNAVIADNDINVKGNHTIGIGSSVDELTVDNNNIVSDASNEGDVFVWDSMGTDTTGIKITNGNFSITNNDIDTTGDYAAILGDSSGNVTNNQLSSNLGAGNDALIGLGNVNATGNPETRNKHIKVILVADDLTKVESSADQFVVKVFDENGKAIVNKSIEFILDGVKYANVTDFDGVAKLDISLAKGNYSITTKFVGDKDYATKSINNNIVVNAKLVPPAKKLATKITAKKKTFKAKAKTKKYSITLKAGNNPVKKVTVTLKIKGKTYKATTNAKGKATFKIKKLNKKGSYKGTVSFAGNGNYLKSSAKAKIKVKK
jgi:hypothetical protein